MADMGYFREMLRRNPERLSQVERAEREAIQVAESTGRYYTRGDGKVVHSKSFVADYTELCLKHNG
jgi:GrpB-like predicted nucleotidyltransferase (UPF0157 family)